MAKDPFNRVAEWGSKSRKIESGYHKTMANVAAIKAEEVEDPNGEEIELFALDAEARTVAFEATFEACRTCGTHTRYRSPHSDEACCGSCLA